MDDVRGDFLEPPHGTTPAAVTANKILRFDPLEAVKKRVILSNFIVEHYLKLNNRCHVVSKTLFML